MFRVDKKLNLCEEVQLQLYKEDKEYYVDAEDLWKWLEVKTKFTDWIKRRIKQYEFKEKLDYRISILRNDNGYRGKTEKHKYFLKSDMAKQLAMVEDAKKGALVRRFYLDLEKYVYETNQRDKWLEWRSQEAHDTRDFHSFIDNDKKCMGLCKELKAMVAYKYNLKYIYSKEMYFQEYLSKHNQEYWLYYLKLRTEAEDFTKAFKSLNNENYMHNVIVALQNNYINNIEEFKEYKNNHKSIDEFPKQFGRPHIE